MSVANDFQFSKDSSNLDKNTAEFERNLESVGGDIVTEITKVTASFAFRQIDPFKVIPS